MVFFFLVSFIYTAAFLVQCFISQFHFPFCTVRMRANLSHVSEPDTDRQSPFASPVLKHLHFYWDGDRRINSQYSPLHRTSLATDYRESNLTLDTWEKVRSKGLSLHWRGSKYSTLVALIRNATAGYWRPGSSDKAAILAEVSYRRHHTTTGQRSGPSTSLIPIQWSSLTHHNDVSCLAKYLHIYKVQINANQSFRSYHNW